MFYCHYWWQRFFLLMYSHVCCKIRQFRWEKFVKLMSDKQNLKTFLLKEIHISCFNVLRMLVEDVLRTWVRQGTSIGVTWRTIRGCLLGMSLGRPRDVILPSGYVLRVFQTFISSLTKICLSWLTVLHPPSKIRAIYPWSFRDMNRSFL